MLKALKDCAVEQLWSASEAGTCGRTSSAIRYSAELLQARRAEGAGGLTAAPHLGVGGTQPPARARAVAGRAQGQRSVARARRRGQGSAGLGVGGCPGSREGCAGSPSGTGMLFALLERGRAGPGWIGRTLSGAGRGDAIVLWLS